MWEEVSGGLKRWVRMHTTIRGCVGEGLRGAAAEPAAEEETRGWDTMRFADFGITAGGGGAAGRSMWTKRVGSSSPGFVWAVPSDSC